MRELLRSNNLLKQTQEKERELEKLLKSKEIAYSTQVSQLTQENKQLSKERENLDKTATENWKRMRELDESIKFEKKIRMRLLVLIKRE